jgi:aminoglycoside phosphotransferase (APT) family kinase protein
VVAAQSIERLGDDELFLDAVEGLTRTIARIPGQNPARVSLSRRLDWYERRVRMLLAETGASVDALGAICRRIDATLMAASGPQPVMVHGDLHVGQLFVDPADPGRILGVLDIDTAGLGDPADDAAAMHAHLIMSALTMRAAGEHESAARYDRLAERWRQRWVRGDDPDFARRARAISATHLLAHTLGRSVPAQWLLERANTLV